MNIVPTMAGSNRDEVKLWLATARYFVDLEYSLIGSILSIPKIKLSDGPHLRPLITTEVQHGK